MNNCKNCRREMPNDNWETKKGCIWCDGKYHGDKK